jgi:hypothetical protein
MRSSIQFDRAWMSLWIIGSVCGWMIGFAVNLSLSLLRPEFNGQFSFLPFLVFGICVGLLQWSVALRDIVKAVEWTFATTLASFLVGASLIFASNLQLIPQVLEYFNPGCLSASCDRYKLHATWISGTVVFSLIVGLSAALPTGFVLSRYGSRVYLWVFGCILASLTGVLAYLPFALSFGSAVIVTAFCCFPLIGPILVATVSAPFIDATLREPARLQQ